MAPAAVMTSIQLAGRPIAGSRGVAQRRRQLVVRATAGVAHLCAGPVGVWSLHVLSPTTNSLAPLRAEPEVHLSSLEIMRKFSEQYAKRCGGLGCGASNVTTGHADHTHISAFLAGRAPSSARRSP